MIGDFLRKRLAAYALKHGRLLGVYRRFCHPDGDAWAATIAFEPIVTPGMMIA